MMIVMMMNRVSLLDSNCVVVVSKLTEYPDYSG
jgi:hypothetical protein